jgi:hypothetical protein
MTRAVAQITEYTGTKTAPPRSPLVTISWGEPDLPPSSDHTTLEWPYRIPSPPRRVPSCRSDGLLATSLALNGAEKTETKCDSKTRHQFVTKTRLFIDRFDRSKTGKARQARGFSCCTSNLTRWRSAVRARTGLPSIPLNLNSNRQNLFCNFE